MRHLFLQFAAATALTAASLATANAHATLEKAEAAPGAYKAVIRIGHGCDGQPTRSVRVEVPEGYVGVRPQPKAGWSIEIERGDYAHAYTLHGRDVASGVKAVTWTGGLLDDAYYDEFVMAGTLAAATGGHSLFFKTLQTCDEGKVAWEEIPASGQDPHSLDHPAPGLVVLAASDNDAHGHGHGAAHGHDHDAAAAGGAATTGDLEIEAAWARATLAGQKAAGGYLTIANKGSAADRLVGASSPLAGKVEIHTMEDHAPGRWRAGNPGRRLRRAQAGRPAPDVHGHERALHRRRDRAGDAAIREGGTRRSRIAGAHRQGRRPWP
jgi:uncharacterized protein YcnI